MGLLNGKVALVTGAGGGLGRAYAHLFAREGARVVVNDLGVARDGEGSGQKMADTVVNEIKEAGGVAVANYGSVAESEDARAMVQQAIDEWGALNIVVNNAGILRDKTLVKMTEDMWDLVIKVHLKGTFLVTHAAIRAMSANGGRIINTSSLAGLKGNFGQSNYGAAKAGIAGFTRVVALETRKMGITCNAIAPVAKTRMTDDIDMVPDEFEPEDIAPLVCWLASDEAENVTGRIFGAHGSHFFEYLTETTPGVDLGKEERWTPSMVGEKFEQITEVPKPVVSGGEAGGPIDTVRALFEAVPATFKAEKAGDWKAKIVFDIGGQASMSLVVKESEAEFKDEAVSSPSAKVTFDAPETLLAMATGELAPEQAFMSGKVKTDNMGALMKFGQYFDLAAAAAALSTGAAGGNKVETLFEALPETFKAEKAGDWGARIVFDIGGAQAYSLVVESGSASYEVGAVDSPTGKVTFDSEATILDMALGKLAPEQAFMSGKVKTDNMGVLMKFGQFFDLEAAASELGSGGGSAKKGLNYDAEGKKYRGKAKFVQEEDTIAYARATDDDNEHYVDTQREGGIVAPPLFPVKPLYEVLTQAIGDDELNADLLRLVHGEQDMRFHRHLRPWDLAAARAEISSIEQKSSGDLIEVHQWLMVDGEMTTEARSGLFIRGEGGGGGKKKDKPAEPERDIIFEEKQIVAEDQPKRYADASDDHNPIHVDPEVAKSAGLPSVILHGLCTMAFAGRAVVNGPCDGDPHRLKRLKVRFSKPVLPGWELTTRIWKEDDGVLGLEVVNQDGVKVITNGLAEIEG